MKFIRNFSFFVGMTVAGSSLIADSSVHKPRMPRGLTPDKQLPIAPPKARDEQPRNFKKKRKGLQGNKKRYTFSQMNFEELKVAKDKLVSSKDYVIACKYLERMITLCDNINEKAKLIIELADVLFNQRSFDDAVKWYTEFTTLYPGNKHVEYASYRAIVCYSKKILGSDRDQTPTEKTLELADAFLKRDDLFTEHKKEVLKIQRESYQRLAASDCRVVEFFINSKEFSQAQKRLANIRSEWIDKLPEVSTELACLEVNLAARCSDFKPSETSIKLAQAAKPPQKKIDMAARF